MAKIPNKNVLNGTTNPTTSQFKNEMSNLWEYINAPEFPGEVKLIGTGKISADKNGTGAYIPLTFNVGGSEKVWVDTSGNVGIGVIPPTGATGGTFVNSLSWGSSQSTTCNMFYNAGWKYRANGYGWIIQDQADGTLRFSSAPNNVSGAGAAASAVELLRIGASGTVHVDPTSGLGYGVGAGGTVTQATSKSTAVTLNKPCGQITMNNAELGANTTVAFTLNNSLIAGADNVVVTLSGGVGSSYQAWAVNPSWGSVSIVLRNITAVSLSESPVINFAIIKGATA